MKGELWEIKGGLLIVNERRVVLSSIASYRLTEFNRIEITLAGGSTHEVSKVGVWELIHALDKHFSK